MSDDLSAPFMDRRHQLASAALTNEYDSIGGPAPVPKPVDPVSGLSLKDALSAVQATAPDASTRAGLGVMQSLPQIASVTGKVAKDVGTGVIETPRAIVTGVRDAYQNTVNLAKEFGGWLEEKGAGGLIINESGVHLASGEDLQNPDLVRPADYANLPHLMDNPSSVTGGVVKGVAQFLTGMKGMGKIAEVAGVPELSGAAAYGAAALKGALASAAVFDPHQQRLSDLVQKFPVLQNPVTEYLASNPDDNAAEGRFKNALEGLGMGVITDGFVKGVRLLKGAMQVQSTAQQGIAQIAPQEASQEIEALLAPKPAAEGVATEPAPLVVQPGVRASEKLAAAATRTTALTPDDVAGRMVAPLEPIASSAEGRALEPPKTFINFGRIDTPDDVQRAMQGLADSVPLTSDTAKEGVRSFDQMKLDAAHTNAWDALVSRQTGQPLSDSQMLASRQLWASATDKMAQLAQEAATNPSDANLFAFRKMMATHNMIQNEVLGARASIARAQASMRIPVGTSAERLREIQFSLESSGGGDVAREMAHAIDGMARAGMISEMSTAAEKGAFVRTVDAAKEAWTLGLLTSPKTHLRNIVSNAAFVPMQMVERATAAKFAQFLGDTGSVQPGEAAAQYYGMTQGAGEMFRYYGKLARSRILEGSEAAAQVALENPIHETGLKDVGKMDLAPAISSEALKISPDNWLGKSADAIGSVYGVTSKALTAEDNFFKVLAYRMETHAQAFRQTMQELHRGDFATIAGDTAADAVAGQSDDVSARASARMADLIANPPENIRLASADQALYQTFNEAPGWFGQMLLKGKRNSLFAHILVPFARTTANLQRSAFERTPLAPMVGQWRADLVAGGARRDLALARWTLGTAAFAALTDYTSSGLMTGKGPVDPGQRAALSREGWQPYSVKIGDRWVSYNGISPIGDVMGMAADVAETAQHGEDQYVEGKDVQKLSASAVAAVAGNIMNKSYLSGLADVIDAIHDPNGPGATQWLNNMAGSAVPSGVAAVTRAIDPNIHAVNSMTDAMRARIPFLSESLPVRHDLWGEPITIDSGWGKPFDVLSPISSKKPTPEPIDKELLRLNANVEMPSASVTFSQGNISVPVNLRQYPDVYERYVELAGNELKHPAWGLGAKDLLNQIVEGNHPLSAVYRLKAELPNDEGTPFAQVSPKEEFIRSIVGQYRELARNQILKEYPQIAGLVDEGRSQIQQLKMPVLQ